jgi:hypothetical protein
MENPFEQIIRVLEEVRDEQRAIKEQLQKFSETESDALLTREEKANQLKVTLATLRNWEVQGLITPVRLGRRVYFQKETRHPKAK